MIRCVRLASFNGNIGDNANHNGTYRLHRELLRNSVVFEERLEIRDFYWKRKKFDDDLIDYINTFDLFMIGGGNYLELWPKDSETGTSINISSKLLSKIKTPISLYSLGCDDGQGVPDENIKKFKSFIDQLIDKKSFISLRNDGSRKTFLNCLGDEYSKNIFSIPDGGFFLDQASLYQNDNMLTKDNSYITVNIAGDMIAERYNNNEGYDFFLKSLAEVLIKVIDKGFQVIFVPHIYKDIYTINDLIRHFPDDLLRKSVIVAPYLQGDKGMKLLFSIYKSSELVIAMRFHANACPLGMNKKTIGLNCYPQIRKLYDDIDFSNNMVNVNTHNFKNDLVELIDNNLKDKLLVKKIKSINDDLNLRVRKSYSKYDEWLGKNCR